MITDITETSLNACMASMMLAELAYPKTSEGQYDALRPEVLSLLTAIAEFEDFTLPPSLAELQTDELSIIGDIMQRLSRLRSRINGEVLPVTFFTLGYSVCRGVIYAAFDDEEWLPYRQIASGCLNDLGLDSDAELAGLQARAQARVRPGDNGDDFLRNDDRIDVATQFLFDLFGKIYDRWTSLADLGEQVAALITTVTDFRRETREAHDQILSEISGLRQELVLRMVAAGASQAAAEAAVDPDAAGFIDRVRRWARSDKARDALEAAMWAALDFVPAGTAVKLGIKVLAAVRKSTK